MDDVEGCLLRQQGLVSDFHEKVGGPQSCERALEESLVPCTLLFSSRYW